ncbi:MAG: hypothetical protein ACLSB9_33865 [Hydrogeniiclostridium mannosilyticum]
MGGEWPPTPVCSGRPADKYRHRAEFGISVKEAFWGRASALPYCRSSLRPPAPLATCRSSWRW